MITKNTIEKVKQAVNLCELVKSYGVKLQKMSNNLWIGNCPHKDHNDDTPSFRIWKNKDNTYSWACMACHCGKKNTNGNYKNYGSDCFAFVQWMSDYKNSPKKLNFKQSVYELAKFANIKINNASNQKYLSINKALATTYNKSLTEDVIQYLQDRGLDINDINKWVIGLSMSPEGFNKELVFRIAFPLFDEYKNILGFSSRKLPTEIDKNIPKYKNSKNSEIFNKSKYLYGIHNLNSSFPEIRITEGVMDVILADKYNVKNVVCTLGTAFTEDHIKIIKEKGLVPCFCLDGDEAGIVAMKKAIELLASHNIYAKVLILPNEKDLADLALEYRFDLEQYIKDNAKPYWKYCLDSVISAYENSINDLRMKMLPRIQQASNGVFTKEEELIMKSYVKERTGILL